MVSVDLDSLPSGPLSMAALVSLEPAPLRRLLKSGLRRGMASSDLASLLADDWQCSLDSPEAQALLAALQERGWLGRDGDLWKTKLG